MIFLFCLLMFFNLQIAYIITEKETKNDKLILKAISFIVSFFLWPMMLFIEFYKNKKNNY
jgi:hypothetical protein